MRLCVPSIGRAKSTDDDAQVMQRERVGVVAVIVVAAVVKK